MNQKLKEQAKDFFASYPDATVALATEDGIFFLPENRSEGNTHATATEQKLHEIRKADLDLPEEEGEFSLEEYKDLYETEVEVNERLKDKISEKDTEIEELKNGLNDSSVTISDLNSKVETVEKANEALTIQLEDKNKAIDEQSGEISDLKAKIAELTQEPKTGEGGQELKEGKTNAKKGDK